MNFEIGIAYRTDMPEQPVLDLAENLRKLNLRIETEERENAPFAALEWAIPAAVIIIITKAYIDGLTKEAAKEHYPLIKKYISDFAKKILSIKQNVVASSNAPNKLSESNLVSKFFSIWAQTLDGKHLRFLFLNDKDDDFSDHCSDKVFDTLMNHAREFPNDKISNQISRLASLNHETYLLFDESSDEWKIVDIQGFQVPIFCCG